MLPLNSDISTEKLLTNIERFSFVSTKGTELHTWEIQILTFPYRKFQSQIYCNVFHFMYFLCDLKFSPFCSQTYNTVE